MKECNICCVEFEKVNKCFHGCSLRICTKCISKILCINHEAKVYYKCPVCRKFTVLNRKKGCECYGKHSEEIDKKFSNFCFKNEKITKKIIKLYQSELFIEYNRDLFDESDHYEETNDSITDNSTPFSLNPEALPWFPTQ